MAFKNKDARSTSDKHTGLAEQIWVQVANLIAYASSTSGDESGSPFTDGGTCYCLSYSCNHVKSECRYLEQETKFENLANKNYEASFEQMPTIEGRSRILLAIAHRFLRKIQLRKECWETINVNCAARDIRYVTIRGRINYTQAH